MNKITGIYMILNHANDKIYIGQSIDIKTRWKQHKSNLNCNRHENKHLQSAWDKYGKDKFEFIILCECEEKQLNTLEQYYIFCFNTIEPEFGYNNDYGGNAGRITEETKKKISESLLGNIPWNKGKKTGQIPWNKGLKYNNPKISESNKGKIAWNRTEIICLNTLEKFNSIHEAGRKYNLAYNNIHKNIKHKINSCGNLNGVKLVWCYYEEYLKLSEKEIKDIISKANNTNKGGNNPNSFKIICLNTLKIFDSMREAEEYYQIWKGGVHKSCKEHKPVGKIKYEFKKYDEYLKDMVAN